MRKNKRSNRVQRSVCVEDDAEEGTAASQAYPFVKRILEMSKNVQIDSDLSKVLKDYLQQLHEYDKYIQNDIFTVNFAEAALFIENSVQVYGKKVDLYWDMVFDYQKRLVESAASTQEKKNELEKLEERKQKYKRRRKVKQDETQVSQLVNQYSFGHAEEYDYLNKSYEPHDLLQNWAHFDSSSTDHASLPQISTGNRSNFLPDTAIHTEDGDYLGRYNQLHSASVLERIFDLDHCESLTERDRELITGLHVDCHVINDFMLQNAGDKMAYENLGAYISRFVDSRRQTEELSRQSFVQLQRLPIQTVADKLRRISAADSMFDTSFDDAHPEIADVPAGNLDESITNEVNFELGAIGTQPNRTKSCSQDSAFFEMDDSLNDSNQATTPSLGHAIVIPKQPPVILTKLVFTQEKDEDVFKKPKAKARRKPRISKRLLARIENSLKVNYRVFEQFYRREYRPGENEGVVPPLPPEIDSDEEMDTADTTFPTVEQMLQAESTNVPEVPTISQEEQPLENYPREESQALNRAGPSTENNYEQEEESRQRVQEWRNFILPKLKQLESKADFDMREYTMRIIDPIPVNETRSFRSIVADKPANEIARFFTATLQLANTNNVQISGAQSGALSNDTFCVKVLDKTQHYELLDDYQAPSEETFLERLEKAKRTQIAAHSTPVSEHPPPRKRVKLLMKSHRKLF